MNRPRGRCTSLPLERAPRHRWARGSGVRERRLSPGRRRRLHLLHRRRHLRLSRRSVELRHGSLLNSWLLELGLWLHRLILRQRLRILHRLRRRRRVLIGHRSRLLVNRLALLYRLILVLNGRLLLLWWLQLLWLLQLLQRLRLRLRLGLPIDRLRLRHRRGRVLAVVVHADSGVLSERLVGGD